MLNGVQRQDIDKNILNDLMMKTETRTINRHIPFATCVDENGKKYNVSMDDISQFVGNVLF